MKNEYQLRILPHQAFSEDSIKNFLVLEKGLNPKELRHVRVLKRSIDARHRPVYVNLNVLAYINEEIEEEVFERIEYRDVSSSPSVVIVGAGPAGLFSALKLIELGLKPIIVERGKDVHSRKKDIAQISRESLVNPDSNYCFGEGGAGAYSDGKLFTRSKKRGDVKKILEVFCQHGASEAILFDAHPHIGTDKLPGVIENMRNTILKSGGEVFFSTRMRSFIFEKDKVIGIKALDLKVNKELTFFGPVILATGHSARDVYTYLYESKVEIEKKALAIGVRLEHPSFLIDCIQYHDKRGRGDYLPCAEYSFSTQIEGRGVYSFCMCPGGFVIPAASGPDQMVVNGMSTSYRNSKWSNSGMVVEVRPEDINEGNDALAMMRYQEKLERLCFLQGGKTLSAPAQRMVDFTLSKFSEDLPKSSYPLDLTPSPLNVWLPRQISQRLSLGLKKFGHLSSGFLTNDAVLIAIETRTSSPVRITRSDITLQHIRLSGLFPCGEGAGYAGGIVSAGVDGERCAIKAKEYLSAI